MRISPSLALVASLVCTSAAGAQAVAGQFTVSPRGGALLFDRATGLENAGHIGVDATYSLSRFLGVGLNLSFARPQTRGSDFVGALFIGDTTFLVKVTQPVTLVNAGLSATLQTTAGRFNPYLTGGAGMYTLYLDPEVEQNASRFQRLSILVGGGVDFRVAERVGILLDVRDLIFTNFDRDRLNPLTAAGRNTRFLEDFPTPPAKKPTAHNAMISIGFSFIPGSSASASDAGDAR